MDTKKVAWVSCSTVGALGIVLAGGCTALVVASGPETTQDTDSDTPTQAEQTEVALGLMWGQMGDGERAEVCDAADELGPDEAARMIDSAADTDLHIPTAAAWVSDTCD